MGKRGPAPKSSIIQVLRGDPGKRAHRSLKKEIKISAGLPEAPQFLKGRALAEWRRIESIFGELSAEGQRLLTAVDVGVLVCYCEAYADVERATRMIAKEGETFDIYGKDGQVVGKGTSPYVGIKQKAMAAVKTYAAEFGFTPSSRTRVHVEAPREGETEAERDFGY